MYDYFGFPAHTYELRWPAPGAPEIAVQAMELLAASGIPCKADSSRGFDHGVFVPLKVAFPDATVPTFQISLQTGLRAATHIDIGRALAPASRPRRSSRR
ncbi:MAG: class III extradiol ring-cleavage dioxygenase [Planctomycetota bacterium]